MNTSPFIMEKDRIIPADFPRKTSRRMFVEVGQRRKEWRSFIISGGAPSRGWDQEWKRPTNPSKVMMDVMHLLWTLFQGQVTDWSINNGTANTAIAQRLHSKLPKALEKGYKVMKWSRHDVLWCRKENQKASQGYL